MVPLNKHLHKIIQLGNKNISREVTSIKHVLDSVIKKSYLPYEYLKQMQELAWREYFYEILSAKG